MKSSGRVLILVLLVAVVSAAIIFAIMRGGELMSSRNKDAILLAPELDWLGKEVPPLPEPEGNVITVSTFEELYSAINSAQPGDTIVLNEGVYQLTSTLVIDKNNITIRGASNDRSKVVLVGDGFKGDNYLGPDQGFLIGHAENVTIANLTMRDFSVHGISVQGHQGPHNLHVYNVAFIDIGQRSIKVNANDTAPPVENGIVEYCYFEQISEIEKGRDDGFDGDYVAGIDAHHTKNWIIRDNVFKNIRGANGNGRAAIFIWNRSEKAIAERNLIIGCDRSIAFGNPHIPENVKYHMKDGIIRNNMIVSPKDKIGMEIVAAVGTKIYNNTVVNENSEYHYAIKYAHEYSNVDIRNNLVSGKISPCTGQTGAKAFLQNNITEVPWDWFVDPANGNLKVVKDKVGEIKGKGEKLEEVADDFFGKKRDKSWDVGAWQSN